MARDDDEDRVNRRRNRRNPPTVSDTPETPAGPAGPRIAEPTTSYRGSGEFNRDTALAQTMESGQMIPRNHFANEDEWAEYFAKVPQDIKRAHRQNAAQNQERVMAGLADGRSLADLGVTDEKENGRALFRRLSAYGLLDPNYEYNWETGQKRNVGTSDLNARNRWEAISPSEMQERQTHQAAGGDFAARMRQDAGNRMGAAINNGTFTRGENGLLYNDPGNDSSRRQYYDDRGYFIDPTTKQRIGGGHSGFVYGQGNQSGAGVFTGVGGAWGGGNANPAVPQAPATPYYRPNTNPWGTPGASANPSANPSLTGVSSNSVSSSSYGGAPSPVSQRPNESPVSTSPWRLRRRFGAQ